VNSRQPSHSLFDRAWRALTVGSLLLIAQIAFESLAVTTAMPTVAKALNGLSLYAIAFGITFATSMVGMVISGQWSDAKGPAPALVSGLGWFVIGLLVSGFAPSMSWLIVGRAMQGFGSGQIIVALYVVIGRAYPSELRTRMFAAFAGAWVIPSLVGPVLAGLTVQYIGWRWVFLAVAILVIPAGWLARSALLAHPLHDDGNSPGVDGRDGRGADEQGHRAGHLSSRRARTRRRLAFVTGAAASVGLLHYAGHQQSSVGYGLLVPAFAGMILFGTLLLPRGAFTLRHGLPSVVALRGLAAGAYIAAEVFVPLMLSMKRGLSPAMAGLSLTAGGVLWAAGSWYQARPTQPFSKPGLLRIGMLFTATGIATCAAVLIPDVPADTAMVGWAMAGFGLGLVYPTLSVLTLDLSKREEQGENSSALQLSDSMFSTAALAIAGSVFAALVAESQTAAYVGSFAVAFVLALIGLAGAGRVRGG
jgi:MFS family permease